jgi:hypothetical protein
MFNATHPIKSKTYNLYFAEAYASEGETLAVQLDLGKEKTGKVCVKRSMYP